MRCATAQLLILKRLHEPLAPEEGLRLGRHLEACSACRASVEGETAFEQGLRRRLEREAVFSPPVIVNPERVLRHWRNQRPRHVGLGWRVAVGTAAAAGLALAGWKLRPSPVLRPGGAVVVAQHSPAPKENPPAVLPPRRPQESQRPPAPPRTPTPRHLAASRPASTPRLPYAGLPPAGKRSPAPAPTPAPVPDERYFDGRDPGLMAHWMAGDANDPQVLAWGRRPLPPVKDDFVRVPLPRLADIDPKSPAVGEAIRNYEEEARVVDARLFRKVSLACKAMPLEEFCKRLTEETGVKIQAGRSVRDEKVTVFVTDRPARDVMREVARLFGYLFSRSGEPNSYRYELLQDLRSQLAEEEMRNRDVHEALIALDTEMAWFRPYLNGNLDQLIQRVERNTEGKDPVANRLYRFAKGGGWGPAQVYFRLSPAERTALLAGKSLRYTMSDSNPERRLPAEWKESILKSSGLRLFPTGVIIEINDRDKPSTPVHEVTGLEPEVNLNLNRSEAGEIALWVGTNVSGTVNGKESYGGSSWELAKGRSPSTANPDNARANAALKNNPLFQRKIDLEPQPSCARIAVEAELKKKGIPDRLDFVLEAELKEPHVNTADVWEEIHRRTQLPIVADAYTQLFPVSRLARKELSTFDALCQVGDAMRVRWKKDGDFLLGRSPSFFWDKLKEVPDRLLRRWQEDRDRLGGLPLEDLLEMAQLSDEQLGSHVVGLGITHCWGLDEWGILGGGPFVGGELVPEAVRKQARALLALTPAQLRQCQTEAGLSPHDLKPAQREVLMEGASWGWDIPGATRLQVVYIPRGRYCWQPLITREQYEAGAKRWPRVFAATREEALARARKFDPNASPGDIKWTRGRLDLVQIFPNGDRLLGPGGPSILAPLQ